MDLIMMRRSKEYDDSIDPTLALSHGWLELRLVSILAMRCCD